MDSRTRELERIHAAYQARDAANRAASSPWMQPAFRLQRRELERALLEEIARAGAELSGAKVLEVGCGTGDLLARFLDYGAAAAAGIDLMEHRIAEARQRHPRLELVAGDASRLPWEDASFEFVTQFTCISSVIDNDLRRAIASEMWRVLAPGGLVLSYDMHPPPWLVRMLRRSIAVYFRGRRVLRSTQIVTSAVSTPVAPLRADELRGWFSAGELRLRTVALDTDAARLVARTRTAEQIAVRIPSLRVHTLAVARKPRGQATSER